MPNRRKKLKTKQFKGNIGKETNTQKIRKIKKEKIYELH